MDPEKCCINPKELAILIGILVIIAIVIGLTHMLRKSKSRTLLFPPYSQSLLFFNTYTEVYTDGTVVKKISFSNSAIKDITITPLSGWSKIEKNIDDSNNIYIDIYYGTTIFRIFNDGTSATIQPP